MPNLALRARLQLVFGVFLTALLVTTLWGVPKLGLYTEDAVFRRRLELELARQEQRLERGESLEPAPFFRAWRDPAAVAAELALDPASFPTGIHELQRDAHGREVEWFLARSAAQPGLVLLYDVTELEILQGTDDSIFTLIVAGGLLATLVAGLGAYAFGRGLFRAFDRLGAAVEGARLDPAGGAPSAEDRRTPGSADELERLGAELARVTEANRAAMRRERNFTRNASHEMRTPITGLLGALELLERDLPPERRRRLVARARGAAEELEELVTVFLWLARDTAQGVSDPTPSLRTLVLERLAELAPLGYGASAPDEVLGDDFAVEAPRAVVAIAVRNLVQNAAVHGSGRIEVELRAPRLLVRNPTAEDGAAPPQGYGFGRHIVEELSQRFGWTTSIAGEGAGAVVATIDFGSSGERPGSGAGAGDGGRPTAS